MTSRNAARLLFLLLVLALLAHDALAQTVISNQLVMRCVTGSRLSTLTEAVIYQDCDDGKVYISKGTGAFAELGAGGGGVGTVTSVGFSAPTGFTVTGSPITGAGTITLGLSSHAANLVLASPDGSAGLPVFRSLTAADLPSVFLTEAEAAAIYVPLAGNVNVPGTLTVGGSATIGAGIRFEVQGTANSIFRTICTSTDCLAGFQLTNDAQTWFMTANGTDADSWKLRNSTSGADVIVVTTTSNVALGPLSTPQSRLHVYGGLARISTSTTGATSTDGVVMGYDGYDSNLGVSIWNYENGGIRWGTNNLVSMTMTAGGSLTLNKAGATLTVPNLTVTGTCSGCTGTGDSNNVGAFASRPAAGVNAGNTYWSNDAPYMQIDDGSALVYFGPVFRFYLPSLAAYTAVNQGSATADQTNGTVWVTAPAGTGSNLRIWKRAEPATPYTITMAFQAQFYQEASHHGGFTWRDSGTGRLTSCHLIQDASNFYWQANNWNGPTSWNSTVTSAATSGPYAAAKTAIHWVRAADDGTNKTCSWSLDGVHFTQFFTAGSTSWLAAGGDEVGFYVSAENAAHAASISVYSWQQ